MANYEFWASMRVELDLCDDDEVLLFDKSQIRQVLVNLLRNAADASNNAAEKKIIVRSTAGTPCFRVDVIDNGCGITDQMLAACSSPSGRPKQTAPG